MTALTPTATSVADLAANVSSAAVAVLLAAVGNDSQSGATMSTTATPSTSSSSSSSIYPLRMLLTITHLTLVSIGFINLVVIFVIVTKPYMRSITNVYMLSLCAADFIYLSNLTLVAATQLNDKSWPFGSFLCTTFHGTETTGKYASVLFVVLLAVDRYCAMCKANWCSRYRNHKTAIVMSLVAWLLAIIAATPLFIFSEVVSITYRMSEANFNLCIAKWPNIESAKWYISFSSILIFALPLALIVFCYYHIINKLREALKGSKRLRRASSSRAPYHRVTRLVLWVVVFHVICWTPFWLFNVFSSILSIQVRTHFDRIVVNILHLLPYMNCALNPLLYAAFAENFRQAVKPIIMKTCNPKWSPPSDTDDIPIVVNGSLGNLQKSKYSKLSYPSKEISNFVSDYQTNSHLIRTSPSPAHKGSLPALNKTQVVKPIRNVGDSTFSVPDASKWSVYRPHSKASLDTPPFVNVTTPTSTRSMSGSGVAMPSPIVNGFLGEPSRLMKITSMNSVAAFTFDDKRSPSPDVPDSPVSSTTSNVPSISCTNDNDVFV